MPIFKLERARKRRGVSRGTARDGKGDTRVKFQASYAELQLERALRASTAKLYRVNHPVNGRKG